MGYWTSLPQHTFHIWNGRPSTLQPSLRCVKEEQQKEYFLVQHLDAAQEVGYLHACMLQLTLLVKACVYYADMLQLHADPLEPMMFMPSGYMQL